VTRPKPNEATKELAETYYAALKSAGVTPAQVRGYLALPRRSSERREAKWAILERLGVSVPPIQGVSPAQAFSSALERLAYDFTEAR
jgi:hypothetical protein